MAQVRSVLSRRQLVEIPQETVHSSPALSPPSTWHTSSAAGFASSALPPGALSLCGMLLRRGAELLSVLWHSGQGWFLIGFVCAVCFFFFLEAWGASNDLF